MRGHRWLPLGVCLHRHRLAAGAARAVSMRCDAFAHLPILHPSLSLHTLGVRAMSTAKLDRWEQPHTVWVSLL